ncbi:hypothetical protein Mycsm_00686 [Mycobacterium sp. JS623]|uniref:hypothetical protein n=1 Tax=Mycobacterium sp. JS623 TaxID=212767 RepID=UPI0002A54D5F|nr:hypothetical protein [Mycobacterium sp. JS623]AGB21132.1 hypothetical protein Mycsm_00686 [Mycobacterium sp. JS623]
MNIINGAVGAITRAAEATTAAAGAVGGAAVNGVIGGMQGTLVGVKNGISSGSHSTPAAALTLAAIGAAGLVEWPVLLGVGGTALVVHQLNQRSGERSSPTLAAVPDPPSRQRAASPTKRSPGRKATKAKSTARSSSGRTRRPAAKR